MLSWGLLSGAMAFVGGPASFHIVRVLLGIAEAGFFPGIIFFLTPWFPASYRARIIGYFMAAVPVSSVIGGPVSGLFLGLDGLLGMHGWQWLFLIEAAPALILSVVVFFYLTDRPADATWLDTDERAWLVKRLEQQQRQTRHDYSVLRALLDPKVPGPQPGLFRRGRGQLRADVLPAPDRSGVRDVQRPCRAGVGTAVLRRHGQHGALGPSL